MKKLRELIKGLFSSEIFRYGVAGGVVTISNYLIFLILFEVGIFYSLANVISLVLSKTIGYLMNKLYVYRSRTDSAGEFFAELFRFVLARGFTGLVDFFGLILLVEVFHMDSRIGKWIVMALVIVLNYILGKKAVFIKKKDSQNTDSQNSASQEDGDDRDEEHQI